MKKFEQLETCQKTFGQQCVIALLFGVGAMGLLLLFRLIDKFCQCHCVSRYVLGSNSIILYILWLAFSFFTTVRLVNVTDGSTIKQYDFENMRRARQNNLNGTILTTVNETAV